jgi:hypothetical protein
MLTIIILHVMLWCCDARRIPCWLFYELEQGRMDFFESPAIHPLNLSVSWEDFINAISCFEPGPQVP